MAIDKTIRIQDLPVSDFLNSDNLIIINDSDNITRSITFENFIDSITQLPNSINLPPTEPGVPGINFCDEQTQGLNCGTGIGSQGDCNVFISTCGTNILEITGNLVTINGDLEIDGDLIVDEDTTLKGNVNIGTGCSGPEKFVVSSETLLNCKTDILGDVTIGTAPCATNLEVNSKTTFNCEANFEGEVNFDEPVTINGDLIINGDITPPGGGSIDIEVGDITAHGEIILGKPPEIGDPGCDKNLEIYNKTFFFCDAHSATKDITLGGTLPDDTNIKLEAITGEVTAKKFIGDGSLITNLNIPGSLTFKGNINVTDSNSPALVDPQTGDLYINEVSGNAADEFDGLNGGPVALNQFVFFLASGEWDKGSIQDQDGFVTLSTTQTVTGDKIFTGKITSQEPDGSDASEVVNVSYLQDFTNASIDAIRPDYVTIATDQTVTGQKTFSQVAYGTTPPDTGTTGKELVTIEYLSAGGLISPWSYDPNTKELSPTVNTDDVQMIVAGSGEFGHIDISKLNPLPTP